MRKWFWVALIGLGSPLTGFGAGPGGKEEGQYCAKLVDLFSAQEIQYELKQKKQPVPDSLQRKIDFLTRDLFEEEIEVEPWTPPTRNTVSTRAGDGDEPEYDFIGYDPSKSWEATTWSPDSEISEWMPESERPQEENERTEQEFFALEQFLNRLESYVEGHERTDAHERVESVFRRMMVNQLHRQAEVVDALIRYGVMDPTQQVTTLEFWAHNMSRNRVSMPDRRDLERFAAVMQMDTEVALRILSDSANRPANVGPALIETLNEIVLTISESRLDLAPAEVVKHLREVSQKRRDDYPVKTFGKLLYYVLNTEDELASIHDARSLKEFLESHPY